MINLPVHFSEKRTIKTKQLSTARHFIFLYVTDGELSVSTHSTNCSLCKGDVLLLSPEHTFDLSASTSNTVLFLSLDDQFIYKQCGINISFICNSAEEPQKDYGELKKIILQIFSLFTESPEKNQFLIMGKLYYLLDMLVNNSINDSKISSGKNELIKYKDRKKEIINYIEENYQEHITLQDLADYLYLTPQYVSAFFKKNFSVTFKQFLNKKRLFHAERAIKYTNNPLVDIASDCGFSNFQTFYKNFVSVYKKSPNEYRKNFRRIHNEDNVMEPATIGSSVSSSVESVTHTFTVRMDSPVNNIGSEFIMNIGGAQNLLLHQFQKELLLAKQRFSFQYVRICDILSTSLIPKILPDYNYFFHNIYQILTFLYENNLIPFIELTRRIFTNLDITNSNSVSFHINSRFMDKLESFLSYCTEHLPVNWLSQWHFELWMSPDETVSQYCDAYAKIRQLIRQYIPDAKIGGPGYNSCSSACNLEDFLSEMKADSICPDFISVYLNLMTMPHTENSSPDYFSEIRISTDEQYLLKQYFSLCSLEKKYFPKIPVYITEMTSLFENNSPLLYSCFQSAFLCKNLVQLFQNCPAIGYWQLMDPRTAIGDSTADNSIWGQGLITKSNHYTPAYYMMDYLLHCRNSVIDATNNYIAARIDSMHFQIIAYHYTHIDAAYCSVPLSQVPFYQINKIFGNHGFLSMNFYLSGLDKGVYQITQILLDKKHGSTVDQLIAEFNNSNINPDEFFSLNYSKYYTTGHQYKNFCVPSENTYYVNLSDEEILPLQIDLSENAVCIWDIQKKFSSNT